MSVRVAELRAAVLWARADVRQRWRSLVVLGLLFGVVGALAAAFLGGARRTETAYERFHSSAHGGDAVVLASRAGLRDPDWSPILALREVDAAAAYANIVQQIDIVGRARGESNLVALLPVPPGELYSKIEVPQLVEGRPADPNRADEVVISTTAHRALDLDVGDELDLRTQTAAVDDPETFDGTTFRMRIVGIGRVPLIYTQFAGRPVVFPTPAVLEARAEIQRSIDLVVQLQNGRADVPALRAALRAAFGTDVPVADLTEAADRVRHGTSFERNGLLLLAVGVSAVGLLMAGQALARAVEVDQRTASTLRALGLGRRGRALALALPAAVVAATAMVVTAAGASALNPRFPIGLARQLEPDPGMRADWPVLALGIAVTVVAVAVAAAIGGSIASAAGPRTRDVRASLVSRALRSAGLPVLVDLGARFALESPSRGDRAPVRPVLLVVVVGVLGAVAMATVSSGLDDALESPSRAGQHWDALYFPEDPTALEQELLDREDVTGVARAAYASVSSHGVTFAAFAIDAVTGPASFTLRSGRAPEAPNEVMLGVATAERLQVDVGGDLVVERPGDREVLRVVGTGLVPQAAGASYDDGAWVTTRGMERLGELSLFGEAAPAVLVRFDGSLPRSDIDHFETLGQGPVDNALEVEAQIVANLRSVRRLPLIEGACFVLLALGSVRHLLLTTATRRRDDLALLWVLGFTRSQTIALITWQGIVVGLVALALGVPFGLATGSQLWHSMTVATSLDDVGPVPHLALVVAVPLTLLITGGFALGSTRAVLRRPPTYG